jgi:hypothetical protein
METRREMLLLSRGLMVLVGASLAGCVGYYPQNPGYPPQPGYTDYPPPPPAAWNPNMVWLPSPEVYVALGLNFPVFFDNDSYYSNYQGHWYSGRTYRGPWQRRDGPPPRLRDFHPNAWGDYQSRAHGYYQSDPHWRHFNPPR